ncbi:hypothetical protein D3C77_552750 [compost metagenome]
MGTTAGAAAQGLHQLAEVARSECCWIVVTGHAAQQLAQGFVLLRIVGHQLVLVAGVERNQGPAADPCGEQLLPVGIGVDPGDEVLPQHWITQPAVFFHRQVGALLTERGGEQPAATFYCGVAIGLIHLDPLQPAGR